MSRKTGPKSVCNMWHLPNGIVDARIEPLKADCTGGTEFIRSAMRNSYSVPGSNPSRVKILFEKGTVRSLHCVGPPALRNCRTINESELPDGLVPGSSKARALGCCRWVTVSCDGHAGLKSENEHS